MPSVEEGQPRSDEGVLPPVDLPHEHPARARDPHSSRSPGDEQPPPLTFGRSARVGRALWVLLLLADTAALVVGRALDVETQLQQGAAALLGVLLAAGLAVRAGGRPLPAALLAAVVGAATVVTQWSTLLAGAALAVGVLAASLAVLGTVPAASFVTAVREVVLAQLLAGVGALGVAGFLVDVDTDRFVYTVLALGLAASFALVYRLGGGLHGLGRRGLIVAVGALGVLVVALAYTAALSRWGSPELILQVQSAKDWTQDHLGAVPHPIEVLLGVPALAWGVTMRDRRRQGWWVCAFGAAATSTATTRLLDTDLTTSEIALGAGYSVVLGLLLGYAVIRAERLLTGTRGRRARRTEGLVHRPEPPRLWPLH